MSVYSTVGVAVERFISVCIPHSQVNMLKMVKMVMMIYLVSKERFIFQPVWVLPPESSVYIGEQKFKNFRDDHFKFMSLVQKMAFFEEGCRRWWWLCWSYWWLWSKIRAGVSPIFTAHILCNSRLLHIDQYQQVSAIDVLISDCAHNVLIVNIMCWMCT